jgi:hypothetical protein
VTIIDVVPDIHGQSAKLQAALNALGWCRSPAEVLGWMRTLPLFIEDPGFRAIHACWSAPGIAALRALAPDGVLTETQRLEAAGPADRIGRPGPLSLFDIAETLTKGPEARLPTGYGFRDPNGKMRSEVRVKWWKANAHPWRNIALSVPDMDQLPDETLPHDLRLQAYPDTDPLVTYTFEAGERAATLDLGRIRCHE